MTHDKCVIGKCLCRRASWREGQPHSPSSSALRCGCSAQGRAGRRVGRPMSSFGA
ncbi:hypothetical protein TAL182_CH02297 [Rhizobium sp. TAL182]|nr:hypothetical protein TAL182_CH02297 [Rhizobium sp. TAL182]